MGKYFAPDSTGRFHVKTWQDEAVAYDNMSGDTHLLEPVAVEVLQYLARGVRSEEDIYCHLNTTFDLAPNEDGVRFITMALMQLKQVGIVVVLGE